MNDLEKIILLFTILLSLLTSFTAGVWYGRNSVCSQSERTLELSKQLYNAKIQSYLPQQLHPHKTVNFNLIKKFRG